MQYYKYCGNVPEDDSEIVYVYSVLLFHVPSTSCVTSA